MWRIKSKENRISELISKADMDFTTKDNIDSKVEDYFIQRQTRSWKEKEFRGSCLSTRSCLEVGTGSSDWARQRRRFYLKTERESNFRNIVSNKKN
jgi:hypothetical protein